MAENTKIAWATHTFNPWMGCQKVSPGCEHCYAEELMDKRYGKVQWGPQGTRIRMSKAYWRKPHTWESQAMASTEPVRVFCASLADVFEDRPEVEEWRAALLHLIQSTPRLTWMLLTKRPENVNRMIERATGFSDSEMWFYTAPHVWIGTSVEDQRRADERIPELLNIPARVHFLSCEPLLAPVNLNPHLGGKRQQIYFPVTAWGEAREYETKCVDWVIVGGESGRGARPCHTGWVQEIVRQCRVWRTACFVKQMGSWWGEELGNPASSKNDDMNDWPYDIRVREFPK